MTPEGKVKKKVTDILKAADYCYYFMPVQTGYGMSTLDYLGVSYSRGFAIETKAPGKKPTKRQEQIIREIRKCGGLVFIIDGKEEQLEALKKWLTL